MPATSSLFSNPSSTRTARAEWTSPYAKLGSNPRPADPRQVCTRTFEPRLGQDNYDDYLSAQLGEGRHIRVGLPRSVYPRHYKRDSAGKVYSGGNEPGSVYFDDSVPWEGYFVDYIRNLSAIAPWGNLSFHATSEGARIEFKSSWDAAVQDVGSGINDVAVSDFWVTQRRANLAIFSNSMYARCPSKHRAYPPTLHRR